MAPPARTRSRAQTCTTIAERDHAASCVYRHVYTLGPTPTPIRRLRAMRPVFTGDNSAPASALFGCHRRGNAGLPELARADRKPPPISPGPSPTRTHALSAPASSTRSAPGFRVGGGRGKRVRLQQGGARVEGAVALQRGEDAVLLRQRPEGLLPRFLLRQARRHLRLRDGDGGAAPSPRRWRGSPPRRRRPAQAQSREAEEQEHRRRALHEVMELAAAYFRGRAEGPRRRAGARLSRRAAASRPQRGSSSASATRRPTASACATISPARACSVETMIEAGLLVAGDDIPVPYRPLPRPRDVPDRRPARAG